MTDDYAPLHLEKMQTDFYEHVRQRYDNLPKQRTRGEPFNQRTMTMALYRKELPNLIAAISRGEYPRGLEAIVLDWDGKSALDSDDDGLADYGTFLPAGSLAKIAADKSLYTFNIMEKRFGKLLLQTGYSKHYYLDESSFRRAKDGTLAKIKTVPHYFRYNLAVIAAIYRHIADETSRDMFLSFVKMVETGDVEYLLYSPYRHYMHPLVSPELNDVVVEGGGSGGYPMLKFAEMVRQNGKVYSFDPSADTIRELKKQRPENVILVQKGLWSKKENFYINPGDKGSNRLLRESAPGCVECSGIDLDSFLDEAGERCDLIKLDIEGSELECLYGAIGTLRKYRPKLQISIYHRISDYLEIPLFLLKQRLDYVFFFGKHTSTKSESVLYAVPRQSIDFCL